MAFGIGKKTTLRLLKSEKYFLNVSYQSKVTLNKAKMNDQKVCAVDLGINNSAVCSVMDIKGTVLARKFINQPNEKDRLYTLTNKLRQAQRTRVGLLRLIFEEKSTGFKNTS
ncbi:hypothetical protein [Salicibibacter cibi]|uniref:hypothetical protein n=1 Tax=Salicibibacter cibi TaxID=2743001 RepID=UPI001FE3FEA5|nr:hypothetical protein [Salicibibacter cibi]